MTSLLTRITCVSTVVCALIVQTLPATAVEVGATAGEFNVSNGNASYTLPIKVAPGRGGMQPDVALSYNSAAGNGIMGVGWNLSAVSAISRCPANLAQDGFISGITFGDKSRYCLDGERLIPVSGANGAVGTEYRTEIDGYSRIRSVGGSANNPAYFVVDTKAGHTMTFGLGNNATVAFAYGRLNWLLSEVNDSTGNNPITYKYRIQDNKQYLDSMEYSGGKVNFVYEQRADENKYYIAGSEVHTRYRLRSISSYHNDVILRNYHLTYQSNLENTLLSSVQECTSQDSHCFNHIRFGWQGEPAAYNAVISNTPTASGGYGSSGWQFSGFHDTNGDGLPDAIWTYASSLNVGTRVAVSLAEGSGRYGAIIVNTPTASGGYGSSGWQFSGFHDTNGDGLPDAIWTYASSLNVGTRVAVSLAEGSGRYGAIIVNTPTASGGYGSSGWQFSGFHDTNGDGLPDAIWTYASSLNVGTRVAVSLAEGSGRYGAIIVNTPTASGGYGSSGWQFSGFHDTNGDGLPDAIWTYASSLNVGTRVAVSLAEGSGRYGAIIVNTPTASGGYGSSGWQFSGFHDTNSDGLPDAIWTYASSLNVGTRVAVSLAEGSGRYGAIIVNTPTASGGYGSSGWQFSGFHDTNGDGLPDAIWTYASSLNVGTRVAVSLAEGSGRYGAIIVNTPTASGGYGSSGWQFSGFHDTNGDGLPDAIWTYASSLNVGTRVAVSLAEGLGRYGAIIVNTPTASGGYGSSGWQFSGFHDTNGDGLPDAIWTYASSLNVGTRLAISLSNDTKPRLSSITDSLGTHTDISYASLTDKTVYTKGTGAAYPVIDLQYPQYVVSSVTADDGIGGSISTNYHYEGLKAHVKGRGSYGFAKITETYPDTGKTQETWFDQSGFPFTGHVLRHTESYNGQLLNESTTEYSQDSYYAGVESVHAHRTVQRSYELDGSLISTVTSLSENIDAYGNVGTVTVITEGGGETFTQTTVSQYDNNTDNWHLGRLMEARTTHTTPQGDATPKLSRFTYDAHTGLLDSESIISTQTGETFQTTVYQYDSFGQKIAVTLRVPNHADRTSTTERDVLGRPTRSCNPLGLCETFEYNEQGLLATQTGPNGITTRWSYDGFQRKRLETRADGNQTRIDYYFANSNQCGERATFAHYCSVTESSGSPAVTVQFDNLGREVRKITTALNGLKVYHETEYNHLGEVYRVSRPYFLGDNIYWASTQYDAIGRVVEITEPGPHGSTNTINNRYNGLTTTTYNGPKQLAKTTRTNALGQTVRVEEEEGSSVEYRYTVDGQLLTTTVAGDAATTITLAYDERGRKISMDDPDMGYWTYAYDAYGQLIQQTDAKGQVVTMDYDQLGRLVRRQETEGITTWQYGDTSAPLGSIGKLLVESNGAVSKTYEYDHFGRTVATTHTIEGTAYTTRVHYDALGRVIKTDYPGGQDFYTENLYSELGFLHSVRGSRLRAETGDLSQLAPLILAATDLAESYETRAHTLRRIGQRYRAKLDDYRALLAIQTRAEAKYQADLKEAEKEAASQPLVSVQVPISVGDITIFVPGWRSQLVLPTRDPVPVPHLSDDLQADLNSQKSLLTESINNAKIENPHVITLAPVNVNGISIFIPVENGQGVTPTQNLSSDEQTNLTASIGQNQTLSPAFLGHLNNTVIELENVIALLDQHIGSYTQLIEQITVLAEQTLAAADQSFHYTRSLENGAESYQAQTADTQHITYWQALDADASGRITAESYGNGIVNDYSYNTATGQLQVTHSGLLGSTAIRHIEYQYDAYNNVTLRDDLVNDIRETFEYDRLDRLTATHLVSERFIGGGLDIAQTQNYDVYGNITYKSDVGHYQYTSGRPHAVSSAGNHQYHYDANGNMLEGDGRRFTWNSFNKPIHISKNGKSARFSYGLDRARYKKINHTGDTTWYVGGLYEKQVTDNGQHTRHQYYIYAAGNRVASHSVSSKEGVKTHYLHKDALGSIDTMTDADGQVVDRRSYDAWGKQRHFDWQGAGSLYSMRLLFTTRAYTDHESIEEVGLIHMNGRVYDASLARFVSADPHIQAAGMSQSYNRYSYVLNNPMKYTDPSGYFFKKLFKSIKKAVKKVVKAIKPFIGVIIAAVVTFYCPPCLALVGGNAVALGALAGAAAGAASAAVNGGNILKGAITGGISGAIFAGIGVSGWEDTAKVLAHGVAGGFMSVVQGGKFGQGFLSAGFAKFATTNLTNGGVFNMADRSTGNIVGRTAVAAVVGGTASKLGGGKFANGAVTAAFAYTFANAARRFGEGGSPSSGTASGSQQANPNRVWENPTGGQVRGCDSQGCGGYGEGRSYGPHQGADYVATPGQDVVAVTDGVIDKIGYPYTNDLSYRYARITTLDGYVVRQLYVAPASGISVGASVSAGQTIGTYQGLGTRYPGITEHVHVDIRHNGQQVNPTTLIPSP